MFEQKKKAVNFDLRFYVDQSIRKEMDDWAEYVCQMADIINQLLDAHMVPLSFSVHPVEWNLPEPGDPIYENIKNIKGIPSDIIKDDANIPKKTFLCWLLSREPVAEEEINMGFVGGDFKGMGGFCVKQLPPQVLITTYGELLKDTLVFAHEIFHLFGLPHNENPNSMMHERPGKIALDQTDVKRLVVLCRLHRARKTI